METRRWALFSWGLLTIGILLGGWWSYEVLGWSGVWAWDPGREREPPAVVDGHRVHPLGARAGATGDAAGVEPQPARRHVRADDPRHVPHAVGRDQQRPRVRRRAGRRLPPRRSSGSSSSCRSRSSRWRGDRLRSPGAIDSPVSREGAFLANNVLFTVFAFIVLLGTVYPLLVEALQDRRTVVGAPYFDRLSMPIGIALLFMMAVAPALPWRKASTELLRDRLFWPAWCGAGGARGRGRGRRRGLGSAHRLRARRVRRRRRAAPGRARHPPAGLAGPRRAGQRRHDRAPRRDHDRRRAGGVEQLHALGDDPAAGRRGARVGWPHVRVGADHPGGRRPGERRAGRGAASTATRSTRRRSPSTSGSAPTSRRRACGPGSPKDVYLTIAPSAVAPMPTDREVTLRVFVKPMVLWLWIGGAVMAIGTILAAFPGRSAAGRPNRSRHRVGAEREMVDRIGRGSVRPRLTWRRPHQ